MVVKYAVADDIAIITLNRPENLNAVIPRLVDELCDALDAAIAAGVGAAILAGEGRSFCAGHDLKYERGADESESRTQDIMRIVRKAPFPVIAAVQGYAVGAGCEFALCSDLVIAAESAQFGFPEVSVGLAITGGISQVLPLAVGLARAKELVLSGEFFSAQQALQMGLINRIVADQELSDSAMEWAKHLASRPRQAMGRAKRVLDTGPQIDMEAALQLESLYAQTALDSPSAREAEAKFRKAHTG